MLAGLVDFALAFVVLLAPDGVLRRRSDRGRRLAAVLPAPRGRDRTRQSASGSRALNVGYRDVRYMVPFITQFWLFATPIAYPSSLVREPWRASTGSTRWWASWKVSLGAARATRLVR